MLEAFVDNPQQATQHLALGFDLEQRRKARQENGNKGVYNWVQADGGCIQEEDRMGGPVRRL